MAASDHRSRIKEEERRLVAADRKREEERRDMGVEERWQVELKEAFDSLAVISVPTGDGGEELEIGRWAMCCTFIAAIMIASSNLFARFGFRRLMLDGKLLGMLENTVDEHFSTVDFDGSGTISFEELWKWFLPEARQAQRTRRKKFVTVSMPTIVPARLRAVIILMKRFAEKNPVSTSVRSSKRNANINVNDVYDVYRS